MPEPVPAPPAPEDPLTILTVDVLPAGITAETMDRVPVPAHPDPLKNGAPIDLDRAIEHLADASLRVDARFDRVKREVEMADELRKFEAAGMVQGIQTMPAAAIAEKRRQIEQQHEQRARQTQADFATWRAVVGRLLHEARAEAVQVPAFAANPADHLGGIRDLLCWERAQGFLGQATLPEAVRRYEQEDERGGNRVFIRLMERGERPVRSTPEDGAAAVRLAKLVRERQAARLSPALRTAFKRFETFTSGVRGAKLELLRSGAVR